MALTVANVDNGGYISPKGLGFASGFDGQGVISGFRVRPAASPNMTVRVGGEYNSRLFDDRGQIIDNSDRAVLISSYVPYMLSTNDNQPATTNAVSAHGSLPTKCVVVLYVNTSLEGSSVVDGSNGACKVALIAGTPSTEALEPTESQISSQTRTNDYIKLAYVTVPAGATTITDGMIEDIRQPIGLVGTALPYFGVVAARPARTLVCDGSQVNIADYALLYRVVRHSFARTAAGDARTPSPGKFYLPDLRGRTVFGQTSQDAAFSTIGNGGGEKQHRLTVEQLPPHKHNLRRDNAGNDGGYLPPGGTPNTISAARAGAGAGTGKFTDRAGTDYNNGPNLMSETGGGQAFNILPPYLNANWLIRY